MLLFAFRRHFRPAALHRGQAGAMSLSFHFSLFFFVHILPLTLMLAVRSFHFRQKWSSSSPLLSFLSSEDHFRRLLLPDARLHSSSSTYH